MIAEAPRVHSLPGSNGSRQSRMVELQRARLVAATGQVACEHGISNVTVAHIVERAGASRRTFYEIFTDSEDCVEVTLQAALDRAQARVRPAWQAEGRWRERVRRSLVELLCLFDEDRVLARLLLVESLGAGSAVLEQRARLVESLVDAVHEAHAQERDGSQATRLAVEGAVGGVLGVLHARIAQGTSEQLLDLAGALMSMLVLPAEGSAAARRELERPVHALDARDAGERAPLRSDPFKDAGMRFTYRTMRVLNAIADHPDSSNRQVGAIADVSDQGQVSKLLSRLERLGLIANVSQARKGERNVWRLTVAGAQLRRSIESHAEDRKAGVAKP